MTVGGLLAGAALASGCGGDDASSSATTSGSSGTKTVRVAYIPAFGTLPLHVAQERGLFEKHGLKVEATEGTDVAAYTAALGKKFDVTLSSPSGMLTAAAAGRTVQVVSGLQPVDAEHPNNVLVTKAPLQSIADLKGKKVGVALLAGLSYDATRYLLMDAGVNPEDVQFSAVPLPTMADQVKAGQLDAAVSSVPFFTGLDGLAVSDYDLVARAAEIATDGAMKSSPAGILISDASFGEQQPETVAAFRDALQEAMAYIDAYPDEARTMVTEWLKLPPAVAQAAPMPAYTVDIDFEALQPWVDIAKETGSLRADPPPVDELVWSGAAR
jgi:NitT/TauT family transport system substrate-binding protein